MVDLPSADLYLFGRGEAQRAYLLFGCHKLDQLSESGQEQHQFVVWAPHARSCSLVGDFNDWDESANPMDEVRHGIFACIVEGLEDGDTYKYCIVGADGIPWATPISDILAMVVALVLFIPFWKGIKRQMQDKPC